MAWEDARGSGYHVYAQRLTALGKVKWAASGVPISTAAGSQLKPRVISDGAGGAIVA